MSISYTCCCLPTPMALASGGSPMFPLVVHQPGFEEGIFVCSELGKGATSEAGKYLFRAASVWWRCAQYFVIASCG